MTVGRDTWASVRKLDGPDKLTMGPNTSNRYLGNPSRIAFMLARYTAAAKMLDGSETILDVGCGDGFGTATFLSNTDAKKIIGIDFDEELVAYANRELRPKLDMDRIEFRHGDILDMQAEYFDGICSLDCVEHIEPERSQAFLETLCRMLHPGGLAVIGTPNEYAAHLGSAHSRLGHINSLTPQELRADMLRAGFSRVLMWGMNDTMLHSGHPQLWHYVIGLGFKS